MSRFEVRRSQKKMLFDLLMAEYYPEHVDFLKQIALLELNMEPSDVQHVREKFNEWEQTVPKK